jgi:hypothetical protein
MSVDGARRRRRPSRSGRPSVTSASAGCGSGEVRIRRRAASARTPNPAQPHQSGAQAAARAIVARWHNAKVERSHNAILGRWHNLPAALPPEPESFPSKTPVCPIYLETASHAPHRSRVAPQTGRLTTSRLIAAQSAALLQARVGLAQEGPGGGAPRTRHHGRDAMAPSPWTRPATARRNASRFLRGLIRIIMLPRPGQKMPTDWPLTGDTA